MDSNATVKISPAKVKPKVLLVEDEANIASMVVDWLSETYDMVVAVNGKEALQKAAAHKPDLILEDINLPDMTGYDVVKILEKDAATAGIPVIFLTGEKMVDETVKFIATVKNVRGYVNKPFKLKEFLEKVGLVLSHKIDFVVMEKKAADPEAQKKAERLREVRAESAREPADPRPALPVPPAKGAVHASGAPKGAFRDFFRLGFRIFFWGLWALAAAGAAGEWACRTLEGFVGPVAFLPPLPPGSENAWPAGGAWTINGVEYATDIRGLREKESFPSRSTDSFHAFVLGGTAVFGQGVPVAETFPRRLGSLLNKSALFGPDGAAVVLNGGLWGASPSDQWTAYERLHAVLKPDLLIWVTGPGTARLPSRVRLLDLARIPTEVRAWISRSRLASLLGMAYVYGAPTDPPAPGNVVARLTGFARQNPDTAVMVLRLTADDGLQGLAPEPNLMVFDLSKIMAPDLSWGGLTVRGHDYLAKAVVMPLLQKNRDRIRPPAAQPLPPPSVPVHRRKTG